MSDGLLSALLMFMVALSLLGGLERIDCYMGIEAACDAIIVEYEEEASDAS